MTRRDRRRAKALKLEREIDKRIAALKGKPVGFIRKERQRIQDLRTEAVRLAA